MCLWIQVVKSTSYLLQEKCKKIELWLSENLWMGWYIPSLVEDTRNVSRHSEQIHLPPYLARTWLHAHCASAFLLIQVACHFRMSFSWVSLESSRDMPAFLSLLVWFSGHFFFPSQVKCRFCQVSFSKVNFEGAFKLKIVIILNVSNIKNQLHVWHLNCEIFAAIEGVLVSDNGNVINK